MTNQIKMRERDLQRLLMNYLQAKGWYVQRMNSGQVEAKNGGRVKMAATGTPDIMAFKKASYAIGDSNSFESPAQLLFVEVKTPQNPKPTLMQEAKMHELEEYGARCIVAHSLEELQEQL